MVIGRRGALLGLGAAGAAALFVIRETGPSAAPPLAPLWEDRPRRRARGAPGAAKLSAAATAQIGVTTRYNPAYQRLAFPMGDVDRGEGVCTDVVIRAYRDAFNVDLQALVNADMRRRFSAYPTVWGAARPDPNIDHRRVLNLETFLRRMGAARPLSDKGADWLPGDLVTQRVLRRPHIGVVTDRLAADGETPLVAHNIGRGARLENVLFAYDVVGRFRFGPPFPSG